VYRVEFTPEFEHDVRRPDLAAAQRVILKATWLAEHPEALRLPLRHRPQDLKGLHKNRVGDYRILLWVDCQAEELTLYGVRHHRDVYDLLR
jgi:mRNA-degrading endonuclease RelE of RelBE toxin-antitoxin system